MGYIWAALIVLVAGVFSGCHPKFPSGSFSGHISLQNVGSVPDQALSPVLVRIESPEVGSGMIAVEDLEGNKVIGPIRVSHLVFRPSWTLRSLDVSIPELQEKPFHLIRVHKHARNCFESRSGHSEYSNYKVELCVGDQTFNLEVNENQNLRIRLLSSHCENIKSPQDNKRYVFTVAQAVQTALKRNLEIKMEREVMIQAKYAAQSAYLNLIPHLGVNSINAIASSIGGPASLLGGAGDIVPFLFPGNWLTAKALSWQYKAQKASYLMTRVNLANAVHILALNYVWHKEMKRTLSGIRKDFLWFEEQVPHWEETGRLSKVDGVVLGILGDHIDQQSLSVMAELDQQAIQLAEILGLDSPLGIKDISSLDNALSLGVEEMPSFENDADLKKEDDKLTALAIFLAPEVHQQCFLKEAAKLSEGGLIANWVDTNANPGSIGFSLIPEMKRTRSFLEALNLKIEDIQEKLEKQVSKLVRIRNYALQQYYLASNSMVARTIFYDDTIKSLYDHSSREPISVEGLRNSLEDLLSGVENYYYSRLAAEVAQATLDRLTYAGEYQGFLKELEPH